MKIKEKYSDTNDYELIMLYHEENEDAKNILYLKYSFIIDVLIKKYQKLINTLNIDMQEVYSECAVGFSDALNQYKDDKDSLLPTFINLCVDRKLIGLFRKYSGEKYKIMTEAYSLEYSYEKFGCPLIEFLKDNSHEPLLAMMEKEEYDELLKKIEHELSRQENKVFIFMRQGYNYKEIAQMLNQTPKQIDNAMQRIKMKIRNIINESD